MKAVNDDRRQIMARIREALKTPAPHHGHQNGASHIDETPAATSPPFVNQLNILNNTPAEVRQWLPAVGDSFDDQAALFAQCAESLKAEFHLLESESELHFHLVALAAECGWNKVATHKGALNDKAIAALGLPHLDTDGGYAIDELESCDAGITECEALIAQTGSVLVSGTSSGGRALSVLPPHHIVLARREQLLPDLLAAFALLHQKYAGAYPSMMSFITGPSRTGDIERILVLGAHGPKRLTIYCV